MEGGWRTPSWGTGCAWCGQDHRLRALQGFDAASANKILAANTLTTGCREFVKGKAPRLPQTDVKGRFVAGVRTQRPDKWICRALSAIGLWNVGRVVNC